MSAETLCLHQLGRIDEPKTSQNITFNNTELADIETIKPLLLKHYTQEQIAQEIGVCRETVSRKLSKWMQTDDFQEWAKTLWLQQYNKFSLDESRDVEAFKALTKLLCAAQTRRSEIKAEIKEKIMVASIDLNKLTENDRRAILAAEEAYTRAETSISPE